MVYTNTLPAVLGGMGVRITLTKVLVVNAVDLGGTVPHGSTQSQRRSALVPAILAYQYECNVWTVQYSGLIHIDWVQRILKEICVSGGYGLSC